VRPAPAASSPMRLPQASQRGPIRVELCFHGCHSQHTRPLCPQHTPAETGVRCGERGRVTKNENRTPWSTLSPERRYGARGGEAYSCRWRRWRRALRSLWVNCRHMMADQAVPHRTCVNSLRGLAPDVAGSFHTTSAHHGHVAPRTPQVLQRITAAGLWIMNPDALARADVRHAYHKPRAR
jgi:hypothetical protein